LFFCRHPIRLWRLGSGYPLVVRTSRVGRPKAAESVAAYPRQRSDHTRHARPIASILAGSPEQKLSPKKSLFGIIDHERMLFHFPYESLMKSYIMSTSYTYRAFNRSENVNRVHFLIKFDRLNEFVSSCKPKSLLRFLIYESIMTFKKIKPLFLQTR